MHLTATTPCSYASYSNNAMQLCVLQQQRHAAMRLAATSPCSYTSGSNITMQLCVSQQQRHVAMRLTATTPRSSKHLAVIRNVTVDHTLRSANTIKRFVWRKQRKSTKLGISTACLKLLWYRIYVYSSIVPAKNTNGNQISTPYLATAIHYRYKFRSSRQLQSIVPKATQDRGDSDKLFPSNNTIVAFQRSTAYIDR